MQVIRGSLESMLDGLYPADEERLRPLLRERLEDLLLPMLETLVVIG